MAENKGLNVYLNDHLAGARAGVDLAEHIRSDSEGTPLGAHLEGLRQDIVADRDTLVAVMEALGVPRNTVKQVAGRVLETLSLLPLNERVTGSPGVTRLLEIETLALGIEGKQALWRALLQTTADRPELAGFDFAALADRAAEQRNGLEAYRLEAAVRALRPAQGDS